MREVVALAFRKIGVLAVDDQPSAHDYEHATNILASLFAELTGSWGGCTFTFTVDAIPTVYQDAIATLLAVRLAPDYSRPAPVAEKTALVRIRAINLPYVRDMDFDEDDETTQAEIDTFDRGAFF